MTTKIEISRWLEERGWVFVDMTKEQKDVMRQELNICGYATSGSGRTQPCAKAPSANGRCKTPGHGGNALRGVAHPNYQGKGQSKYIPKNLLPFYEQIMATEVLDLTESIMTLEARRRQLTADLDELGDGSTLIAEIRGSWANLKRSIGSFDAKARQKAMIEIDGLLDRANSLAATWSRILEVDEQKRKHIETETRRRERMREIVTAEDALSAFRDLTMANAEAIMQCPHLTDEQRKELRRQVAELFADRFGMADVSGIIQQALQATDAAPSGRVG